MRPLNREIKPLFSCLQHLLKTKKKKKNGLTTLHLFTSLPLRLSQSRSDSQSYHSLSANRWFISIQQAEPRRQAVDCTVERVALPVDERKPASRSRRFWKLITLQRIMSEKHHHNNLTHAASLAGVYFHRLRGTCEGVCVCVCARVYVCT